MKFGRVYGIFFAETIISLLLFGLLISILNSRFRVRQLEEVIIHANEMVVQAQEITHHIMSRFGRPHDDATVPAVK